MIEELKVLAETAPQSVKNQIEQDIRLLNLGINGENNIAFELKNSHMPMCVLHDIFLSHNGLTAQIDYLIITRKCTFVVECKNLVGNIEISSNGDFIRTINNNGKFIKEGIYSPITQNKRHLDLIKQIRLEEKNFFERKIFESNFEKVYRPVVVLANEKTILNNKFAKKEIKEQIIRADQLIEYIKRVNNECDLNQSSETDMMSLGNCFLSYNKPNPVDYTAKYVLAINNFKESSKLSENQMPDKVIKIPATQITESPENNYKLIAELKSFRLKTSREENIKPYYIFNDNQMNDIIQKMPKTRDELKSVSGFGDTKIEKYGADIIDIIKAFS